MSETNIDCSDTCTDEKESDPEVTENSETNEPSNETVAISEIQSITFGEKIRKKLLPQQLLQESDGQLQHFLQTRLEEENQKLWSAFQNPPSYLSSDIESTMKRVCTRLDKTQQITVACSSQTRAAIGNIKISVNQVDSLLRDYKTLLPLNENNSNRKL